MKKSVIIGAGQTGRGYVARYLHDKNHEITFIEKKQDLVSLLKNDKAFNIHFYNKDRTPVHIDNYEVYEVYSEEAGKAIYNADYIFTAVGEQNLADTAAQIKAGIAGKSKNTVIVTCENGINPGKVLKNHMESLNIKENYEVSQTAVFCSTVILKETRLDILSQNETYFPYDCDNLREKLELEGAVPVRGFENFLKRKIYTYNCLAGLISYCGYIKGFEIFSEAANNKDIMETIETLLKELNPALEKYFGISEKEQADFSQKAFDKFRDVSILDYVIKNGRDAKRKLGPTERIMAPIKIIKDNNGDTKILEFVAAAALCYWEEQQENGREEKLTQDSAEKFCELNNLDINDQITKNVKNYLKIIKENRNNINITEIIKK
jgi:mannitol-1-phosphate 5-dehydrogenase